VVRAILLVDHGSRRPEANAVLEEVAARVRRRRPDTLIGVAHLSLAPPGVFEAIDGLVAGGAREIVVHPYFLAPGSHGAGDIPGLVQQAAARHPEVRLRVTAPLGVHEGLVDAVLARVAEVE
jgi:sirohydrochlorin ferrochelatase